MKKRFLPMIMVLSVLMFLSSCTKFKAKAIKETVGTIDVIVDPNVELMMIIAHLGNAYGYDYIPTNDYLNDVDEWFAPYVTDEITVFSQVLAYQRAPEFGMYLNKNNNGFLIDSYNTNFTKSYTPEEIRNVYSKKNLKLISKFRTESKFDEFFINHYDVYTKMIDDKIAELKKLEIDKWLDDFYNKPLKENVCLHLTYVSGNYGISFLKKDGTSIPHAVVLGNYSDANFTFLVAHEFSHPFTGDIVEKLYEDEGVKKVFDDLFSKYSETYTNNAYPSGFWVLNETFNQSCSYIFDEKVMTDDELQVCYEWTDNGEKFIYCSQIVEFLYNYENNRSKYKTLDDFIPELKGFLASLE